MAERMQQQLQKQQQQLQQPNDSVTAIAIHSHAAHSSFYRAIRSRLQRTRHDSLPCPALP